jgi:hypothetical protein
MRISRRRILLAIAGSLTPRVFGAMPRKRQYRVDVTISMLGATLFTRGDAGSAFVSLHETDQGEQRIVRLHFAGESNPKRTHGIVYAGSMEESVVERRATCGPAPVEVTYFGFVTASEDREEPVRRAAFERKSTSSFVAVEGQNELGRATRKRVCVALPAETWRDLPDLIAQVRSHFAASDAAGSDLSYPGVVPVTFLYSILAAIRSDRVRTAGSYVHNGRAYRLECEKAPDSQGAVRLAGHIFDESSKRLSTFRLWLKADSDLPMRIEFQPRSYLRITLEREEL